MTKLTDAQISDALRELPGWELRDGKLHREYRFADFPHAIGFMTIASAGIEKLNHHPEWFNVYNRVRVDLTTHDAGGVTHRDIELAKLLDSIAPRLS
jgi:4a-hydroxytetrahydrobiopterin dehydratase